MRGCRLSKAWTVAMSVVTLCAALRPRSACPAPVVSSVDGATGHGQTVTILGSGFGTRPAPGPLVWDTFEAGATGALVYGHAPTEENMAGAWTWDDYHSDVERPRYGDQGAKPNSSRHSRHLHYAQNYNISLELFCECPNTGDEVYFTYYWKHRKTSTLWTRNCKPWIEYGTGDGMWPAAYIGFGNVDLGDGGLRNSVQDTPLPDGGTLWGSTSLDSIQDEWIRIEVYLKQSSPGAQDGAFQTWIHRPLREPSIIRLDLSDTTYGTRTTSNHWRQWHFGSYHTADDPSTATGEICIDDLYFDATRARVELGDAPIWAACAHREIQIPAAWSDGQVAVTINHGTFGAGRTAYLFVVAPDGQVNANGWAVTLGAAVDAAAPVKPTGLRVTP